MKKCLKYIYMIFFHPFLFIKYTCRKNSFLFFVNGSSKKIQTKGLKVGKNVRFGDNTRINFFEKGSLEIGDNCYFVNNNSFLVGGDISIGNRVTIASDVLVASENHISNPDAEDIYGELDLKPVRVGNGCWIAEKVCIMPGVEIGDFSVIGAASVVTKSIPSYCIAVGNPAKVIKKYNNEKHVWEAVK